MRRQVVFRPAALGDLEEIYDYIAAHSLTNAERYIDEIEEVCMGLIEFPERGVRRDDLRQGIRTISLRRRVQIAYAVYDDRVEIVRILYGGRDLSRALDED